LTKAEHTGITTLFPGCVATLAGNATGRGSPDCKVIYALFDDERILFMHDCSPADGFYVDRSSLDL
jgi:hypothetical protein